MNSTWTRGSERYRFATKEDLPRITDMLTDPEVGRWRESEASGTPDDGLCSR